MKLFRNFVIGLVLLFVAPAFGQTTSKLCFQNGAACPLVTSSNPLPVSGTFSASLSGFTPNGSYANLTATNASASVAMPSGTTVAIQNAGTTTVSCTLGVGSATAAANEILVPPSSTVPVVVGSNTWAACIDQSGSTSNLIVLAGGSGLGTPFGGGGGGGTASTVTANQGTAGGSPWPVNATVQLSTGSDGSTSITTGGTAQNLFSGATPAHGWEVCNPDPTEDAWLSQSTTAAANGQGSMRVAANGGCVSNPPTMAPFHAISVVAATTGHKLTAVSW